MRSPTRSLPSIGADDVACPPQYVEAIRRLISKEVLTEDETADMLGVSVAALRDWWRKSIGPPRCQFNRQILYRRSSVVSWLASLEVHPGEEVER
jgi:Helix-turn-helix domain